MATRRERVILELEDQFSRQTLQAAAAAKVLDKSLDSVDRTSLRTSRSIDTTGKSSASASNDINKLTGRLALFRDVGITLGPALVPLTAVAVPAVTALAAQMGAAAIAGGTMVAAFQGVGTALEAVNKAALEPTTENLQAAQLAMQTLAPEARALVRQVQEMRPAFQGLRDAAAGGLFPGMTAALADAEGSFDRIETVLYAVGDAAGDLTEDFAEGLAGPRGQEFLTFIAAEVPGALTDLGHTVGNLAAGMAELWQAFTPLNRDASDWLLNASQGFDDWASGLSKTEGFQEFVAYVRESGPKVADALASIGNAVLQVGEAMAPFGGPALAALKTFADLIAALANSSYGPALAGIAGSMVLVSRSMKALAAIKASSLFTNLAAEAGGATGSLTKLQAAGLGAGVGLTAAFVAGNKLVDAFREELPGMEQLTGMLIDLSGGELGALPDEFDSLAESIERINDPSFWKGQATSDTVLGFFGQEGRTLANANDEIQALDDALTNLATTGGADKARAAFADLAASQNLSVDQQRALLELMPGYTEALASSANESKLAGAEAAEGFEEATSAAQQFKNAVAGLNRLLEGRSSMRDYEQALDDFTKGLRENGRSFDINTNKGRLNQANLDNIAATMKTVVEGMKRSDRQSALKQARADIRDMRDQGKLTEGQMDFLLNAVKRLDQSSANPKINVETGAALGAILGLRTELDRIPDETVYINVARRGGALAGAGLGASTPGSATGENYIPGRRWPYGDKVLRRVAPSEAIIRNDHGEADRNRDVIRAINAGADMSRTASSRPVVNVGGTSVAFPDRLILETDIGPIMARVADNAVASNEKFARRLDDRD